MPSAKNKLKAIGLISSLFDIALSEDVISYQLQWIHYMHNGLNFVFICVPFLFSDNARL